MPLLANYYTFDSSLSKEALLQAFEEYLHYSPESYHLVFDDNNNFEIRKFRNQMLVQHIIKGAITPTGIGSFFSIEIAPRFGVLFLQLLAVCIALGRLIAGFSIYLFPVLLLAWIIFWIIRYKREEKAVIKCVSVFFQEKEAQ